ncbi:MAG: transposase [Rhodospirillales bacterium]|nr:transposase [Rhodospirillales bacterium]
MDMQVWRALVAAVKSAVQRVPRPGRRPQYTDTLIVKMYLWAVWHDRPLCWACDRTHYNTRFRPRQLPSVSQFSRRVNTERFQALLDAVNAYLTRTHTPAALAFLDGKPLPVGRCTRDPDARVGYAIHSFDIGYKLHACATSDGRILAYRVRPMNEGEAKVARDLLPAMNEPELIMADANYDSKHLYQALGARGQQLLTPLKRIAKNRGPLKRMGPHRRFAIWLHEQLGAGYRALLALRARIERVFAALTCFGGGLTTLPSWVRRDRRVNHWVAAKIAVYHARLRVRKLAN